VRLRGVPWPVRKGAVRLQWTVEALPGMSPAARLARAIRRVRPDAVHAMEMQIQQLCSRVLWLKSGELAADGPSSDVVGTYVSDAAHSSHGPIDVSRITRTASKRGPIIRSLTGPS